MSIIIVKYIFTSTDLSRLLRCLVNTNNWLRREHNMHSNLMKTTTIIQNPVFTTFLQKMQLTNKNFNLMNDFDNHTTTNHNKRLRCRHVCIAAINTGNDFSTQTKLKLCCGFSHFMFKCQYFHTTTAHNKLEKGTQKDSIKNKRPNWLSRV